MPQPFELGHNPSFGNRIFGLLSLPDPARFPGRRPVVVICHGFKEFMEWGFFAPLAELLRERGLVAVRFNHSGSGMRPGDEWVTDPDAFRKNTFSLERDEILKVLSSLGELAPERVDPSRVGLMGHSRGGAAAVLASAEAPAGLRALVTWAGLCTFERYAEHAEAWRRDGHIPVVNGRTGQQLQLGIELLQDLEDHAEALDLQRAAQRVKVPWLIVHGAQDEVVPLAQAESFASWTGAEHRLEVVPGGDHTFGARHPFVGPTPELIQAMNATQLWLKDHLRRR